MNIDPIHPLPTSISPGPPGAAGPTAPRPTREHHGPIDGPRRHGQHRFAQRFEHRVSRLNEHIEQLTQSGRLSEADGAAIATARDAFRARVEVAREAFAQGASDFDALKDELKAAFKDFRSAVREVLPPDETLSEDPLDVAA